MVKKASQKRRTAKKRQPTLQQQAEELGIKLTGNETELQLKIAIATKQGQDISGLLSEFESSIQQREEAAVAQLKTAAQKVEEAEQKKAEAEALKADEKLAEAERLEKEAAQQLQDAKALNDKAEKALQLKSQLDNELVAKLNAQAMLRANNRKARTIDGKTLAMNKGRRLGVTNRTVKGADGLPMIKLVIDKEKLAAGKKR